VVQASLARRQNKSKIRRRLRSQVPVDGAALSDAAVRILAFNCIPRSVRNIQGLNRPEDLTRSFVALARQLMATPEAEAECFRRRQRQRPVAASCASPAQQCPGVTAAARRRRQRPVAASHRTPAQQCSGVAAAAHRRRCGAAAGAFQRKGVGAEPRVGGSRVDAVPQQRRCGGSTVAWFAANCRQSVIANGAGRAAQADYEVRDARREAARCRRREYRSRR
jgi:hypothetical protein